MFKLFKRQRASMGIHRSEPDEPRPMLSAKAGDDFIGDFESQRGLRIPCFQHHMRCIQPVVHT
ncbi:hypothetical protein D3C85_1252580 [compost metagenome]